MFSPLTEPLPGNPQTAWNPLRGCPGPGVRKGIDISLSFKRSLYSLQSLRSTLLYLIKIDTKQTPNWLENPFSEPVKGSCRPVTTYRSFDLGYLDCDARFFLAAHRAFIAADMRFRAAALIGRLLAPRDPFGGRPRRGTEPSSATMA